MKNTTLRSSPISLFSYQQAAMVPQLSKVIYHITAMLGRSMRSVADRCGGEFVGWASVASGNA